MFSKRVAMIKDLSIGGNNPIRVQTMYDSQICDTDVDEVIRRIKLLAAMGCDIIRFSYVSSKDKDNFTKICQLSPIPIVADIHFDYKLAIEALKCGAPKIRINPGNIGPKWKSEEVIKAAKDYNAAVRIGLNSGSLPHNDKNLDTPTLMVDTALEYLSWFEAWGFDNSVISLKASDPEITLEANRKLSKMCDYPIHIGVTEAGGIVTSCIRSTWALGNLLKEGIGDTIRVSLTSDPIEEIKVAKEMLIALGLRKQGMTFVSCPTCGRTQYDMIPIAKEMESFLQTIKSDITVAIMGCAVNGPGEAREADIGIAGGIKEGLLFKKGKIIRKVKQENMVKELKEEINNMMENKGV